MMAALARRCFPFHSRKEGRRLGLDNRCRQVPRQGQVGKLTLVHPRQIRVRQRIGQPTLFAAMMRLMAVHRPRQTIEKD
ncbi:hypothetical protein [Mesorhizobium xinjiangense]|uniref:hypothetical protein n=1 Tax=Mesorhizobium xinjiangense TaxID=2678685 RepID=UPI0012EE421C|nr:hypothetical protein [Mesorhizobium xinjiangense]